MPTGRSDEPASPAGDRASDGHRIVLAVVAGAHGVIGETRLKLFADSIGSLKAHKQLFAGDRALSLMAIRPGPSGAVARFAEIVDRDTAEALRGAELSVPRAALPALGEGEYYHADLIGLPCVSPAGEALGCVAAIENFGAGDIIEVEKEGGKRAMVAFRDPGASLEGNRVVIDPDFLA